MANFASSNSKRIMNKRNIILLPVFFIMVLSTLISCGEDRWAEYAPLTHMDEWMDSIMRADYLWYNDIPASKRLNYFITPASFLTSAKCDSDNVSHIDTIVDTTDSYGIKASYYKFVDKDTAYNAVVTYVDSSSPAATAGLKRGDWIMKVGGKYITSSNKSTILASGEATVLTLGTYSTTTTDGTTTSSVVASGTTLNMSASGTVTDHPVHYYTTLTAGTKKVGYLVYSSFKAGTSDVYNNELRTAFSSFKSAGVNDIVLDLRYNASGDDIDCARLLASMLVPLEKLGRTFVTLKHSSKQGSNNKIITLDNSLINSGANLNLSRIYIITTSATAKMSELLIKALEPYLTVYTVGATTAGYMGITESYINSSYPYTFNLVTSKAYNASGDTYTNSGITASTTASDTSDLSTLLSFGNESETLLAAALALIKK